MEKRDSAFSRRKAREWAVQMLTAADLNPPDDTDAFIAAAWEQFVSLDEADCGTAGAKIPAKFKAFTEARVRGVLDARAEIDALLTGLLDHWDLYRLGTVERAVLRLGLWELQNADVPKPVVINEAIDIANWFATPKTRQLVNGILDRYAKSL